MERAGDMRGISVPFAAGIVAGSLAISIHDGDNTLITILIASSALMTAASLLWIELRTEGSRMRLVSLFFLLGLFCYTSHSLTVHPSNSTAVPARALASLQECIRAIPFRNEETRALAAALVTGDRTLLSPALVQAFRDSGASHILALSGFHLGVIYMLMHRLMAVFGNGSAIRIARAAVTVAGCIFYTVMVGAGPSIVRACLFIVLNEICSLFPERKRSPAGILQLVLTIQLALKPDSISELGFQLSYLAMCGIILIYPSIKEWYPSDGLEWDPARKIWEAVALSVSCQLFTAPLVWIRFHTFPKYFILTNLIAMPLTSMIMAALAATVLVGMAGYYPEPLTELAEKLVSLLVTSLERISAL